MKFGRRTKRGVRIVTILCAGAIALTPMPAAALEAFDGKLQLHGFFEIQNRILATDFNIGEDSHLAQWWNIVNLEIEWDALPEGWGPFDLVSTYVRLEARYDLVYQSQYFLPSYENRYGNGATRLPKRLSNGRKNWNIGQIDPGAFADKRSLIQLPLGQRARPYGAPAGLGLDTPNQRHLGMLWNVPSINVLFFAGAGPDRVWGPDQRCADDPTLCSIGAVDDSGFYVAESVLDTQFGVKRLPGNQSSNGTQTLGPYRPNDIVPAPGLLRDRANPLRGPCPEVGGVPVNDPSLCDLRPALKAPIIVDPMLPADEAPNVPGTGPLGGLGSLPYRPAPLNAYAQPGLVAAANLREAQGLHVPNAGFARILGDDHLEFRPDTNFKQWELALNWGASQQPWRILREAYIDTEFFDHRLWVRTGLQTIVWGKTELFRAQDQFNPQDVGVASLPSLEESRIPLLATRAVWSFYDVGPVEDVRLEMAFNWDRVVPLDAGRCGEPFAPRPACLRSMGFFADPLVGTGIMGEYRYPYAWEDPESIEGGVRLEFRRSRVSYALTYFNGFEDTPYTAPIFRFERNVDPATGWPRVPGSRGSCDPVPGEDAPAPCLGNFALDALGNPVYLDADGDPLADQNQLADVLVNHHANQQLFHVICANTVNSFGSLLPEACAFNAWNSVAPSVEPTDPLAVFAPRFSMAFSAVLAGQGPQQVSPIPLLNDLNGKTILYTLGRFEDVTCGSNCPPAASVADEDDMPLVPLYEDPGDYIASPDDAWFTARLQQRLGVPSELSFSLWRPYGVARFLNDEQEALIGCGRMWGIDCDVDGFDLLNAEGSVLFQSWPGFEGTGPTLVSTFQPGQPGTVGFEGGPVCTRFEGGVLVQIAGCLDGTAPGSAADDRVIADNPGVTPREADGTACVGPPGPACTPVFARTAASGFEAIGHPFTGEEWQSELAALSWNLLLTFAAVSVVSEANDSGYLANGDVCESEGGSALCTSNNGLDDSFENLQRRRGEPARGRFDDFNPEDPYSLERCSFALPQLCRNVVAVLQLGQQGKRTVRAGGNGRFGRRDLVWHGGAEAVLDYQRRNVVGFAMDFAEDRTGSNWNIEFSWFNRQRFVDNDSFATNTQSDTFNLVVSVDRPTFIRFLNRNRTFFFNGQFFVRYISNYRDSFLVNGPFDYRMTFGVFTGYFQDRLLPSAQFVYDFPSSSGAFLFGFGYRVTESFLIQIGLNAFWGTVQAKQSPLLPIGTAGGSGAGAGQQRSFVENGLSVVSDRDELFFRMRWTF